MTEQQCWAGMSRDERAAFALTVGDTFTSASAAAKAVGATRNMILGCVRRARLRGDLPASGPKKTKKTAAAPRTSFNAFVRTDTASKPAKRADGQEKPVLAAAAAEASVKQAKKAPWDQLPDTTSTPKELWQLGACECHWPLWREGATQYLVCAAGTVAGEVYCSTHRQIAGGRHKGRRSPGDSDERSLQRDVCN